MVGPPAVPQYTLRYQETSPVLASLTTVESPCRSAFYPTQSQISSFLALKMRKLNPPPGMPAKIRIVAAANTLLVPGRAPHVVDGPPETTLLGRYSRDLQNLPNP